MKLSQNRLKLVISFLFFLAIFFAANATVKTKQQQNDIINKKISEVESFNTTGKYFPHFLYFDVLDMKKVEKKKEHLEWRPGVYYIVKEDSLRLLYNNGINEITEFKNHIELKKYLDSAKVIDSSDFYIVCLSELDSSGYKKCHSLMREIGFEKGKELYVLSYINHEDKAINPSTIVNIKNEQVRLMKSGISRHKAFVQAAEPTILSCPDFAIALDSIAHENASNRYRRTVTSVKSLAQNDICICNKENMIDIFIMISLPEISFYVIEFSI